MLPLLDPNKQCNKVFSGKNPFCVIFLTISAVIVETDDII